MPFGAPELMSAGEADLHRLRWCGGLAARGGPPSVQRGCLPERPWENGEEPKGGRFARVQLKTPEKMAKAGASLLGAGLLARCFLSLFSALRAGGFCCHVEQMAYLERFP